MAGLALPLRAAPAAIATPARRWWESRALVAVALACAIVPLLWPALPPLVDLPGHIGRYRILVEAGREPLARHYAVHWSLIGNLGVDLLVVGLHPLLDVEPATRLIVTAIPPLTVAAMLWLAREAHGRLPPAAALALPLAYAFPFQFGFVNFCLAQALALAGMALWLRLARTRPPPARIALFAPLACVVWLCHSFGWAMLGLGVFGMEAQRERAAGLGWMGAGVRAGLRCLPMAAPLLATFAGEPLRGETGDWFHWTEKAWWAVSLLRERWIGWDLAGVALIACVLYTAMRSPRLSFAPVLGVPALLFFVGFLLLPQLYQGGAYVDMRLLPAAAALALLAIRVETGETALERRLAVLGSGFLLARTLATTLAFLLYAQGQAAALRALPALPVGGTTLVLVDQPPPTSWAQPRLVHLAGLAIARRRAFVNEQWALPGQQPIRPLHPRAAPFDRNPSQVVFQGDAFRSTRFDAAIAGFDRCTFGTVWTIDFPPGRAHAPDLRMIWTDHRSAIYRVGPRRCLSGAAPAR